MTSLKSFHSAFEPTLTALLTGLAVSLFFGFCQFISERKRRRDFRNSWAHLSNHQTIPQTVTAPLPSAFWKWLTALSPAKVACQEAKLFPSFPSYFLHHVRGYGFAILSVTLMLVVRWLLEPVLEGSMPFSFFLAAVLFTARTQGIWETLLALVLGFLLGTWFFAQPKTLSFFDYHDWWAAGIYLLIGFGIIWLLKSEQTAWLRTLSADISVLKLMRDSQRTRLVSDRDATNRELLARIVENARDPIISVSPEGSIVTWNRAAEELLGWSSKEAIGQPWANFWPTSLFLGISQQLAQASLPKPSDTTLKTRIDAVINVTMTASPIKDERDQLIGTSFIIRPRKEDSIKG